MAEDEIKSTMSEKDFQELKHEIENNTKTENLQKQFMANQLVKMMMSD